MRFSEPENGAHCMIVLYITNYTPSVPFAQNNINHFGLMPNHMRLSLINLALSESVTRLIQLLS